MSRNVYYFCTKHFKGEGMTYYNELRCIRLLENDPRIQYYQSKYSNLGHIFTVHSSSQDKNDFESEKEQVKRKNYYLSDDKLRSEVIIEKIDKYT